MLLPLMSSFMNFCTFEGIWIVQQMQESLSLTVMQGSVSISNPPVYSVHQIRLVDRWEVGRWAQLEQGTPRAGMDMGTGGPLVTDSLSLPQFGALHSQLKLLSMCHTRFWGFLLKGWKHVENLHKDRNKQNPCKSEILFALLRAGPEPTKYWVCSWIYVNGCFLAESLAVIISVYLT